MARNWKELYIEDVADVIGGGTPSTKDEKNFNGTIPWVTPKDLSDYAFRYIACGERNLSKKGIANSSARLLPPNAVLLTTRAPVGYVAIAANPIATNQGFRSLVVHKGFYHEFVYYLLKANTEQLKSYATGTTFGELSGSTLNRMKFLFPSFNKQRAIARILGTLDDKIELNRKMNDTLEAMARAIFKSWFIDFDPVHAKAQGRDPKLPKEIAVLFPSEFQDSELGQIPKGWRVASLSEVIEINPARSLQKSTEAPYLDMANVPSDSARVNKIIKRPFGSGSKFINGDTLLARITPCLENGKTAFVDFLEPAQVGCGSTEFIVLRPKAPLPPVFAYFLSRDPEFRSFAISNMSGTSGRQRVPTDCFNNYKVVVPSDQVVAVFGKFISLIMQRLKANDEQSHTLASIRENLLPKLLSGEIRVKNAEKFTEAAI